jgi:hypothetical protein
MSLAEQLYEVAETTDASVQEAIAEVVAACTHQGVTPMEAARNSAAITRLPVEELLGLAIVGLARIAAGHIPKPTARNRRTASSPTEARVESAARRERLYQEAKDALTSLFQGEDGRMRSLYDFTAADHKYRLTECESLTRGWRRSARFHQEAMAALKREGVERIRDLSPDETERLRRLL